MVSNHFIVRRYLNFLQLTLFLLSLCPAVGANNTFLSGAHDPIRTQIRTIIIDPGHGGRDPGCSGHGSIEKELTLKIGLKLRDLIQKHYPEVKVIMTRDEDVFVELHERAKVANDARADVFISLHCNAVDNNSKVNGSETYVLGLHRAEENLRVAQRENQSILFEDNFQLNYGDFDPNSPEAYILMSMYQNAYLDRSITLAGFIEESFEQKAQRHSKGVKQGGFLVLRAAAMPSVLVEAGFLTHQGDSHFLKSAEGQMLIAESLLQAFGKYKLAIESGDNKDPQETISGTSTPSKESVKDKKLTATDAQIKNGTGAGSKVARVETNKSLPNAAVFPKNTWYGVQVGAFSKTLPDDHELRKKVIPLLEKEENGLIKYIAGPYNDLNSAEKKRLQLLESGFKGIFAVTYKGKERVMNP